MNKEELERERATSSYLANRRRQLAEAKGYDIKPDGIDRWGESMAPYYPQEIIEYGGWGDLATLQDAASGWSNLARLGLEYMIRNPEGNVVDPRINLGLNGMVDYVSKPGVMASRGHVPSGVALGVEQTKPRLNLFGNPDPQHTTMHELEHVGQFFLRDTTDTLDGFGSSLNEPATRLGDIENYRRWDTGLGMENYMYDYFTGSRGRDDLGRQGRRNVDLVDEFRGLSNDAAAKALREEYNVASGDDPNIREGWFATLEKLGRF